MVLPLLNRLSGGRIATHALTAGVVAYQRGEQSRAARFLEMASAAAAGDIGVQGVAAAEAAKAGDHELALRLWERAIALDPERPDLALEAARAQRAAGDAPGAARRCEQAIERFAGNPVCYALMRLLAEIRLPGPPYLEHLARLHEWLRPRTYVEIGVDTGLSIRLADARTRVLGVDPEPQVEGGLSSNVTLFRQRSDDFFAAHDVRQLLDGLPVDLAFIDGMHQFEYVLRDFINLERCCERASTVLLDDCWPLDRRAAARERGSRFWNGDVWRVLPALRKYRPDLRIRTIATAPAGLCVIRNLDPGSPVLLRNYEAIVGEFGALDYSALEADRDAMLRPCPNDWASVRQLLD